MATTRIRFGPLVTPLPRRRPWKLARETVSVDHLSDGRLVLGVGLGGGPADNAAFDEPSNPRELAARLDEGLEVLAGLWSGEKFHYEGIYYHVKEAQFLPRPLQVPRIPVWVAAYWPSRSKQNGPLRRAARWDGIFPISRDDEKFLTPTQIREIIGRVFACRAVDGPFDVVHTGFTEGDDPARAVEQAASYADAGVTWWLENVNPFRFGWRMQGPWPFAAMRERILQGPPGI
jgi:alkanesulfonate monooxygenase SsuD/methylene tetrahydromethanopterin reductase-like flavin-dependent oxidoreductase (luciferase family)